MAENLKAIRRRIKSVESTRKMTQAMKLVSAAKLRRAQERASLARPYAEALKDVLEELAKGASGLGHPLLTERPVKRRGYIVLTSDRGLCGPYNSGVLRLVEGQRQAGAVVMVAVGKKGRDIFRRRQDEILAEFAPIGDNPDYLLAEAIGQAASTAFLSGAVDQVDLVWSASVSSVLSRPKTERLLPVVPPAAETALSHVAPLFEPSEERVLAGLLPAYVNGVIYSALVDAKAAEHAARMVAMDNATRNAGDLIRSLVLVRNRARQAAITGEIAEIVGGAAALV